MSEQRYPQLLREAFVRAEELVKLYEREAERTADSVVMSFLFYLAERKTIHMAQLRKIAGDRSITVLSQPEETMDRAAGCEACREDEQAESENCLLSNMALDAVYKFACRQAEGELTSYSALAAGTNRESDRSLVEAMTGSVRAYLFEVEMGYLDFLSQVMISKSPAAESHTVP
jgi:hypothetical protein